ncbi:P2Y purinoceptor 2-like isoform X2 [Salmo trutta]|uniref:P2Y purinoceptor 2-like isoform X2 n=1 Tax=Salmo trutta TaxID=8032 RepID=UPI00113293D8|nr:P2Y purinoceptor 2-like isoform X2 [Salmo trutta]
MATFANHSTNESSGQNRRCSFKEDFKYILLPVSYTLVFVIGLALNFTAMYVILFRTKRWKPSTVYMFNLTVCDTLYILTLPFLIYYYADENDWPFSEPFCKLIRFLFYANLYGSILFLCCISLHRFLGVCYPMRSLSWVSARRARLVSVAVWACVLMCQAPVLYFSRTRDEGTERVCFDTTSPELFHDFLVYSLVVSMLLFAFPFMVVMVCYGLMVRKLLEPTWGAGGSQSRGVGVIAPHRSKQKYLEQMDPSQVSCELLKASSMAYMVTRPLASANSCVDPILYFMAGQGFRSDLANKNQSIAKEIRKRDGRPFEAGLTVRRVNLCTE